MYFRTMILLASPLASPIALPPAAGVVSQSDPRWGPPSCSVGPSSPKPAINPPRSTSLRFHSLPSFSFSLASPA
uniref:Secreted protein n=1 Tax=Oryza nivara TaxID=4536 RepID=A0A0E0GHX0_ORYNI